MARALLQWHDNIIIITLNCCLLIMFRSDYSLYMLEMLKLE